MKRLTIGILAHVDSGKTTLSEGMLYCSGEIRKAGRVDHKNAFLDTHHIERERGITIFSKQAVIHFEDCLITLLDTPGHVDFSAETERALQVMDYAIMVISGSEGIQNHTKTLWKLLAEYNVPVFLFVNKMDIAQKEARFIIQDLKSGLSDKCVDFSDDENQTFFENIAMCGENLLEMFLKDGKIEQTLINKAILDREIFPCFFGSALKFDRVSEFIDGLRKYTNDIYSNAEFGAKVYKVQEDNEGNRLTYLKITGGSLKVKTGFEYPDGNLTEKINQIRIYSGSKFHSVSEVLPGMVCAVTGLSKTLPGMGIGKEKNTGALFTEPVMTYKIELPDGTDVHTALSSLKKLQEEEPLFAVRWEEKSREIHIQIMGEIQLEVVKQLLAERFNMNVTFSKGSILYKETIEDTVEGVGHYEPLRHYAEVHLKLEPLKRGSGLVFGVNCSEDRLAKNWQRLVLTHLYEKMHIGVLTGSPITDIKITLIAGRAHQKHTDGGDFRQATYRAVRQGLKMAQNVLLEPWYNFSLALPPENVGRAMNDLSNMGATFSSPDNDGEVAVIEGSAPVIKLRDYYSEVTSYSKGKGKLNVSFKGYEKCTNSDDIINQIGYDSESDIENTADSVFCSHGAGVIVKWDKVREHMHISLEEEKIKVSEAKVRTYISSIADDAELMRIFERTYGPVKRNLHYAVRPKENIPKKEYGEIPVRENKDTTEYLLVDGYNIIFAWEHLKKQAEENLDLARNSLINILCDYKGVMGCEVILVFDAYKVKNNPGTEEKVNNINIIYTKEAETADRYIEKVTPGLVKKGRVKVATSDGLEQIIILGKGAIRVSAEQFYTEVNAVKKEIESFLNKQYMPKSRISDITKLD